MKDTKVPAIYEIKCKVNGKRYIGSAVNPRYRYRQHVNVLRRGKHHNRYLQRAWNKYGEDAFLFEIIELVDDKKNLIGREQSYMDFYKSYNPRFGFNLSPTAGSTLGVKFTEKACENVSKSKRGEKHHYYGKNLSEETRKKMSNAQEGEKNSFFGKSHSEEARKKMSKARRGEKNPNYGKRHSKESKQKMAGAKRGKALPEEVRSKMSKSRSQTWEVTSPTGETQIIVNLKTFCKINRLHSGSMCIVAQGKQEAHKGWKCRKIEVNNNGEESPSIQC